MLVSDDGAFMRQISREWQTAGFSVGLIPTMGALHEGHLSLIKLSLADCDRTMVSIFVNPTQFGPNEDYERYPRDPKGDLAKLELAGVKAVFMPKPEAMFPPAFSTWVNLEGLTESLCGATRPGHFRGVATVVTKLFNILQPNRAYFGEKDFQQLAVIRRLTQDLNLPVEIKAGPTVRESDGLALSSRNQRLSSDEREAASLIYRCLKEVLARAQAGASPETCRSFLLKELESEPLARLDYAEIVDQESLKPLASFSQPALAAVAIWFGKTRLIDNILINLS